MAAFTEIQEAFKGEAERVGIKDENAVVKMVKEIRKKDKKESENKKLD